MLGQLAHSQERLSALKQALTVLPGEVHIFGMVDDALGGQGWNLSRATISEATNQWCLLAFDAASLQDIVPGGNNWLLIEKAE